MAEYSRVPVTVPPVQSKYRCIKTPLPVPESLPILEALERSEPRSMSGQPPVVWHRADGLTVADRWGNRWLDWSSCVLVANTGHAHPEIKQALHDIIDQGLLACYVFPHEPRAALTLALQQLAPDPANYLVFILTTGSEATENCIKLSKTYALQKYGPAKKYFVTFTNAFHGRTMGAQLAGGIESLKTWMVDRDPSFIQVPFPNGFRQRDVSFDVFRQSLAQQGVKPADVAGVMSETYQGGGADFLPVEYARQLAAFCREHDICLTMDEVQAGFGRTGKLFAFEHYGIKPDLIACGKGISSTLPLSAVIGRADIMSLYPPGSMTSTHSASPLCVAAALKNLEILKRDRLVENAAAMGTILQAELGRMQQRYADVFGCLHGRGLVAGLQCVKPGTTEPDGALALAINLKCFHRGLLMFAPVGFGGATVKIAPPLTITEEPLRESLAVFAEAVRDVLGR